jgi:hypothetical protein
MASASSATIAELLPKTDMQDVSVYKFRRSVALHLGVGRKGLEDKADDVNQWIEQAVKAKTEKAVQTPSQRLAAVLEDLGKEVSSKKTQIHFLTFSRVLPETLASTSLKDITKMSREEIANCVWKAFDDPLANASGQGRPCTRSEGLVTKMVVLQETHEDGDVHFHVVVALRQSRTCGSAKRTLQERDHLVAHFSSTHTQFWSGCRCGYSPTAKKPSVDPSPLSWSEEKGWNSLDLFDESQRPFNAEIWKRRREACEKEAMAGGKKKGRFNKLDLTSIILTKGLTTKSALLEYTQRHGTEEMQVFIHKNQKCLKEFLSDAEEWSRAQEQAKAERETDWELVCRTAAGPCPCGDCCTYADAAAAFFDKNKDTLSKNELAAALRSIIMKGPSKTTRVPMVTGPTNSGKTTIFLPFDSLFGFRHVLHKPALESKFALRNILNDKKFLFWDDYRPVEYARRQCL